MEPVIDTNPSVEASGNPNEKDVFVFPASFAQQRLWLIDQIDSDGAVYNVPYVWQITGKLDRSVLEKSLNEIVRRHEMLRTTFRLIDGQLAQVVAPELFIPLSTLELDKDEADEESIRSLLLREAHFPFDLQEGPLLRASLMQCGPADYYLILNLHHIVADAWSMQVFFRELAVLYDAFSKGEPSPLPELPVQYADYTVWQHENLNGEKLAHELDYWKRQLANVPVLELPTDRKRPPVLSNRGAWRRFEVPPETSAALHTLARDEKATLFMVLLAAFDVLLYRYTGRDDLPVGTPIAGRNRPEIEGLIGFFVNTLVIRSRLEGNPTFRTLIHRVGEVVREAFAHQDVPFERLVDELHPERTLNRTPLFQVMFQLYHSSDGTLKLPGLEVRRIRSGNDSAKFDLTLALHDTPGGLHGNFGYRTDLFDAGTIDRMAGHFCTLLDAIAKDPDQPIGDVPLLTETERQELIQAGEGLRADYPRDRCVHELFEEHAEARPGAVALVYESRAVTYRELNEAANRLAHLLQRKGVGPEVVVGVCMERSVELIVSLLGILKAGGAYLPLDPSYPAERLRYMLEDAGAAVLLTQQALAADLPIDRIETITLDPELSCLAGERADTPEHTATATSLAYVMYTSGSTGKPKGVKVTHRNIVRLVRGADYADFGADRVFLQLAPISFDASTFEIWGALLNGARCVLYRGRYPELDVLRELIRDQQIDTLWLTASLFNLIVEEAPDVLLPIDQLLTGGEALSVEHVRRALALLPRTQLINGYGPTENTTFTCCFRIPRVLPEGLPSIPIGRPIANTTAYVLDEQMNPVPVGVPGELYTGGDGVAREYLNDPSLTEARFVPDPFSGRPGDRLYRTGDLGRLLPDHTIEFLGRLDNQIKIRGFRIEPGEIEATLRAHPDVRDAVVVVNEATNRERRLVAYVVTREETPFLTDALRGYLAGRLPHYMVPARIVCIPAIPLTANGKVDRSALPLPDSSYLEEKPVFMAPRTAQETALADICRSALRQERISIHDNLFDLGLNSLIVVHISAQARAAGLPLSPRHFFEFQTIAALAKAAESLSEQEDPTAKAQVQEVAGDHSAQERRTGACLIAIQPHGSKTPFFCFGSFLFHKLVPYFDPDRPFFGLMRPTLDQTHLSSMAVEELAAYFIDEIRTLQPKGPYHLGGFCFGGLVAFEMALQLQAKGEEIGLLALIDAYNPNRRRKRRRRVSRRDRIRMHLNNLSQEGIGYLLSWTRERLAFEYARADRTIKKWVGRLYLKAGLQVPLRYHEVLAIKADAASTRRYVPGWYPGQVTLFRGEREELRDLNGNLLERDVTHGWSAVCGGGVRVIQVPGRHGKMLKEPNARVFAQHLNTCLNEAEEIVLDGRAAYATGD